MEGRSLISADVIARYAADAALEIEGVHGLVDGARPRHHGVRVTTEDGSVAVVLHLGLDWGASAPAVGAAVQERVAEYLGRMTDVAAVSVEVVVDDVAPPRQGA